jgi:hypothetical protein
MNNTSYLKYKIKIKINNLFDNIKIPNTINYIDECEDKHNNALLFAAKNNNDTIIDQLINKNKININC